METWLAIFYQTHDARQLILSDDKCLFKKLKQGGDNEKILKQMNVKSLVLFMVAIGWLFCNAAANDIHENERLDRKQQSMVTIAAFTANGNLAELTNALNTGLDAGLTINEIKETIVHLYAYCGFPRSIRGLQTFMQVLDERKAKGIQDKIGDDASPVNNDGSKYARGKKVLGELTKAPQDAALTGYAAFAPVIDTFLKEHLFADIFERDVLTYAQRELVTISVLSSIGGVEPMLRSHFSICLNAGITQDELKHFIVVIESVVGKEKAGAAKSVLDEVLQSRSKK
jgi:alkylhydroperoxidase/carboxymuconolactone decarboxylase family protein YurZ